MHAYAVKLIPTDAFSQLHKSLYSRSRVWESDHGRFGVCDADLEPTIAAQWASTEKSK